MKFHVYRVTELFEVDVEGTEQASASADAIRRVQRGEAPAVKPAVDLIAFPASSRVQVDPRSLVTKLIQTPDAKRRQAAVEVGLVEAGDPADPAEWLSVVLRRAVERGRVSQLLAAL